MTMKGRRKGSLLRDYLNINTRVCIYYGCYQEANLSLLAGGGVDYNRVLYTKNPYNGTGSSAYNGGGQSPNSPGGYGSPYGTNRTNDSHEGPYSNDVCIDFVRFFTMIACARICSTRNLNMLMI